MPRPGFEPRSSDVFAVKPSSKGFSCSFQDLTSRKSEMIGRTTLPGQKTRKTQENRFVASL